MAEFNFLPQYDYTALNEMVKSMNRQQNTLSFIEESLSKQNNSLANSKSGTEEYMSNFTTSPSLLEQKRAQYLSVEQEFRKELGKAYEKKQNLLMAKAVKFTLQEQARATGETEPFLDPFFSDIDISKLSNLQNYNNVIESKRLEYIRDGYDNQEEIDNMVHGYLSERVSPMVADVIFGKDQSTDPRQREIINAWLNSESTISTAIPELRDVLLGREKETTIPGLKGQSTLDIFLPRSEEEKLGERKSALAVTEIGFGLGTMPLLAGSTAVAGVVSAIDISMGVPAVLRGKDPLQELVLGTERADDLNWWQRALYAVPGLMGIKPTVKATGALQKAVFNVLSNKNGVKQAEQIISEGRAATELALTKIVGSPEWDELKSLANTGKWKEGQIGLVDQLELSDMIEEIEKGTGRLPNELLLAHGRANNPLQNIAQKAALGDRTAIQNIYNLVKRANDAPNDSVRITGDINPFTILNDFRSVENVNVAGEMVKDMNTKKPSLSVRQNLDDSIF